MKIMCCISILIAVPAISVELKSPSDPSKMANSDFTHFIETATNWLNTSNDFNVESVIVSLLYNKDYKMWQNITTEQLTLFFDPISKITTNPLRFLSLMSTVYDKYYSFHTVPKCVQFNGSIILRLAQQTALKDPDSMQEFRKYFADWTLMDFCKNIMCLSKQTNKKSHLTVSALFLLSIQVIYDAIDIKSDLDKNPLHLDMIYSIFQSQWKSLQRLSQLTQNNQEMEYIIRLQKITSNIMNKSQIAMILSDLSQKRTQCNTTDVNKIDETYQESVLDYYSDENIESVADYYSVGEATYKPKHRAGKRHKNKNKGRGQQSAHDGKACQRWNHIDLYERHNISKMQCNVFGSIIPTFPTYTTQ
eukprot:15242_1